MVKIDIEYEGDLHCRLTHGPSGQVIVTDAPKDNQGKGEAFSPTDLAAAALGSCMATIMGIVARRHDIDLRGMKVEVIKEMATQPARRIGRLAVAFQMPRALPPEQRSMLENAALACPVHRSLCPEVRIDATFNYPPRQA
jgi:putative redox protein